VGSKIRINALLVGIPPQITERRGRKVEGRGSVKEARGREYGNGKGGEEAKREGRKWEG